MAVVKKSSKVLSASINLGEQAKIGAIIVLALICFTGILPVYQELNNIAIIVSLLVSEITLLGLILVYSIKRGTLSFRYDGIELTTMGAIVAGVVTMVVRNALSGPTDFTYPVSNVLVVAVILLMSFLILNVGLSTKVVRNFVMGFMIFLTISALFIFLQWSKFFEIGANIWGTPIVPLQFVLPFAVLCMACGIGTLFYLTAYGTRSKLTRQVPLLALISIIPVVLIGFATFVFVNTLSGESGNFGLTRVMFFVVPGIILMISAYLMRKDVISTQKRVLYFVSVIVTGVVFGALLNWQKGNFGMGDFTIPVMSLTEAWNISPKAISGSIGNLFLGLGPSSDQYAFFMNRSREFLTTPYPLYDGFFWVGPYINTILISYGVVGLGAVCAILYMFFKRFFSVLQNEISDTGVILAKAMFVMLAVLITAIIITPFTLSYFIVLAVLAGLSYLVLFNTVPSTEKYVSLSVELSMFDKEKYTSVRNLGYIVVIIVAGLLALFTYTYGRYLVAEAYYVRQADGYQDFIESEKEESIANIIDFEELSSAIDLNADARYYALLTEVYNQAAVTLLSEDSELTDKEKSQMVSNLITYVEKLVESNPRNYVYWSYRGDTYAWINRLSEGYYSQIVYDSYTSALLLNPWDVNSALKLADFLSEVGYYQEAVSQYSSIQKNFPAYTLATTFKIGQVNVLAGNYDDGIKIFEELKTYIKDSINDGSLDQETGDEVIAQINVAITEAEDAKAKAETKAEEKASTSDESETATD